MSHINFICKIAHAYQHMPAYFLYITQNHTYLPTHTRTWVPMMAQWPPLMRGHPFWEATFTQHLGWLLVRGFTVSVIRISKIISYVPKSETTLIWSQKEVLWSALSILFPHFFPDQIYHLFIKCLSSKICTRYYSLFNNHTKHHIKIRQKSSLMCCVSLRIYITPTSMPSMACR